jgi:hypothetical protein
MSCVLPLCLAPRTLESSPMVSSSAWFPSLPSSPFGSGRVTVVICGMFDGKGQDPSRAPQSGWRMRAIRARVRSNKTVSDACGLGRVVDVYRLSVTSYAPIIHESQWDARDFFQDTICHLFDTITIIIETIATFIFALPAARSSSITMAGVFAWRPHQTRPEQRACASAATGGRWGACGGCVCVPI